MAAQSEKSSNRWDRSSRRSVSMVGATSVYLAETRIEPREHVVHKVGPLLRNIVRRLEHHSLLVRRGRAELIEQGILAHEDPVVLAANHEDWRLAARREPDRI